MAQHVHQVLQDESFYILVTWFYFAAYVQVYNVKDYIVNIDLNNKLSDCLCRELHLQFCVSNGLGITLIYGAQE